MYFVTRSLLNWSKELTLTNDLLKNKALNVFCRTIALKIKINSIRHRRMIVNQNVDRCTHSCVKRSLMQFGYEIRRKDCEIINANC
jgi:hypothetical protein